MPAGIDASSRPIWVSASSLHPALLTPGPTVAATESPGGDDVAFLADLYHSAIISNGASLVMRPERGRPAYRDGGILGLWHRRPFRLPASTSSQRTRSSNTFKPSGSTLLSILTKYLSPTRTAKSWRSGLRRIAAVR